jgi:hypothetical protein
MGEVQGFLFEPTFNRSVKIVKRDDALTSDAGVLLLREADHRLGLTASLASRLHDSRSKRVRYSFVELLRERLYAQAQGYRTQDDLDQLAHDPAMKAAAWDRPGAAVVEDRLASQPSLSRWMKAITPQAPVLQNALADWILAHQRAAGPDCRVRNGTLDIDAFPVKVHGKQEGAAYNGYYGDTVYTPLLACFSPSGQFDHARLGCGFVHAQLRSGNAAPAQDAVSFIRQAVEQARPLAQHLEVRVDAAFTHGEVMDDMTDQGIHFVGRLATNRRLQELAEPFLTRPVGRPPREGYEYAFDLGLHRAESWRHAQRVILVIVDPLNPETGHLELFPRTFFLVTNWSSEQRSAEELLLHYRQRGTFEDRFAEYNQVLNTRLSHETMAANEAELLLSLLAFNLVNILRREMEAASGNGWDLGRFEKSVLKVGARLALGSRRLSYYIAASAESLWKQLWKRMLAWGPSTLQSMAPRPASRSLKPLPVHAHLEAVLRN